MAANDGKIYIIITNKYNGNIGPNPVEPGFLPEPGEKESEGAVSKYIGHQFMHFVNSQAKQAISYSINNIGNFTGDYEEQRHITSLLEFAGKIASVGSAAWVGAKTAGPWGAVIGAIVATTSIVINDVRAEYLKAYADAKKNFTIRQLRERSGMYSLTDGNRGTEN